MRPRQSATWRAADGRRLRSEEAADRGPGSPRRRVWAAGLLLVVCACVPAQGGWDADALARSEPVLANRSGHRLGDMTPYPALDPLGGVDRLLLIACRFPTSARVHVGGGGTGWPAAWARAAVAAVDRRVDAIEIVLDDPGADGPGTARVDVVMVDAMDDGGPDGLGDTLGECDVAPAISDRGPRGVMVQAEIRMRFVRLDPLGRPRAALAEEWVGALMHELGHALGYSGHAAFGDTILVRDEMRLRLAGRRALRGEPDSDATLDALYALPPGRRLGDRPVADAGRAWLEALRALRRERVRRGNPVVGTLASVGDVEARIVWRHADGSRLVVRMPAWRRELRSGGPITLVPDRATRALLAR